MFFFVDINRNLTSVWQNSSAQSNLLLKLELATSENSQAVSSQTFAFNSMIRYIYVAFLM